MGATATSNFIAGPLAGHNGYAALDDLAAVSGVIEAGVRARAVADACAALDLAAVLLDAAGRVLHADPLAQALFGDSLRLESDHLVGADGEGNAAIETVLNGVLGNPVPSSGSDGPIVRVAANKPLVITAVRFGDPSPVQLLRAIVFLGAGEAVLRGRLAALDL